MSIVMGGWKCIPKLILNYTTTAQEYIEMTRRNDPRPEEIETLAPLFKSYIRGLEEDNESLRRKVERLEKASEKESAATSRAQHPAES